MDDGRGLSAFPGTMDSMTDQPPAGTTMIRTYHGHDMPESPSLSVAPDRLPGMLNVKDTMTLDHEALLWRHAGAKEAHIRHVFDETPARYYQRLHGLLERPEALAYAPLVVRRLQRLQDARRVQRAARLRDLG